MHISPNVSVLTWNVCLSVACANDCLINADFGDCDPLDDSCLCHNQAFVSSVTVCIQRACSGDELASAESAAQQLCEAVVRRLSLVPVRLCPTYSSVCHPSRASPSPRPPLGPVPPPARTPKPPQLPQRQELGVTTALCRTVSAPSPRSPPSALLPSSSRRPLPALPVFTPSACGTRDRGIRTPRPLGASVGPAHTFLDENSGSR